MKGGAASRLSAARERRLSAVPGWVLAMLGAALAAQIGWRLAQRADAPAAEDLPPAPSASALRLASFGEPAALARLSMVWLLAFDARGDNVIAYQRLDYARLIAWLRAILALDPASAVPLFAAARIYAENADPARMRAMLDFIAQEFAADPNRRWPALAHAALLAKHRLQDLPLARRYAAAIDRHTRAPNIPLWAKQMQIFILEDMDELEAARVMLGGLLQSGTVTDPGEAAFLRHRLQELEERAQKRR